MVKMFNKPNKTSSNFNKSKKLYKKYKFCLRNKVYSYNLGFNFELNPAFIYNHTNLLVYCYYINKHKNFNDIHNILSIINKTNLYKSRSSINVITASILSLCKDINRVRNFINILLSYGFEFTNHDLRIANIRLYKSIKNKIKRNVILFLMNNILLPEINTLIITKLLDNYKHDYYVLPY